MGIFTLDVSKRINIQGYLAMLSDERDAGAVVHWYLRPVMRQQRYHAHPVWPTRLGHC